MSGYEAKAIVRRLFDEAWNQNKVAELDEYTPAPRDRGAAGRANRPSGECAQSRRQRPIHLGHLARRQPYLTQLRMRATSRFPTSFAAWDR